MSFLGILNTLGYFVLCLVIVVAPGLIYMMVIKPYNFWTKKGVRTIRIIPVFGDSLYALVLGKKPYAEMIQEIYYEAGKSRYVGYCELTTPLLMVKCPELIKQLFVKDSDSFLDRRTMFPVGSDAIMSKTLMFLKGQEWKDVRAIWNSVLTPSNVEKIYPLLNEVACSFFSSFIEKDVKIMEVKITDIFVKYVSDLSASSYFGIDCCNSRSQSDAFFSTGANAHFFSCDTYWGDFKLCLALTFPKLAPLFGVFSLLRKDAQSYYIKTVQNGLRRENNDIHRPDLIGLWNERQKEEADFCRDNLKKQKNKLSETEIASQLCMFLLSSLDGLVATLNFITYELAVNPDVQRKLMKELDEIREGGKMPSFDTIMSLPYLDMVISETLRKWPAAIISDRVCTKPYTIEARSSDEHPIHLEVGDTIVAPLYALHHDPTLFSDPDKFDPERFSKANRTNIKPYTYLPWGIGPRYCNAGKLSLLELKITLFQLLGHFELVPTEKTPFTIKLQGKIAKLKSNGGIFLGLKQRKISGVQCHSLDC